MTHLPLPLLGALLAGLAACAGSDPTVAPGTLFAPSRRPAEIAASRGPGQQPVVPPPGQGVREGAALAAACRETADRIVAFRDRGQLMREDATAARIGTDYGFPAHRLETDRLGRIFERDRIAADCVQENTRTAPQR